MYASWSGATGDAEIAVRMVLVVGAASIEKAAATSGQPASSAWSSVRACCPVR